MKFHKACQFSAYLFFFRSSQTCVNPLFLFPTSMLSQQLLFPLPGNLFSLPFTLFIIIHSRGSKGTPLVSVTEELILYFSCCVTLYNLALFHHFKSHISERYALLRELSNAQPKGNCYQISVAIIFIIP